MEATVGGHDKPPTTELKKRVARLRERLRRCDEKLVQCKRQAVEIARVTQNMVTVTGLLQQQAESGLPVAAAKLAQWITALDRYTETNATIVTEGQSDSSQDNEVRS